MAPRRKPVDWTNVAVGLFVSLAGMTVGGFGARLIAKDQAVTALESQARTMPDRRDREIDQLIARVAALEARCRE